MAKEKTDQPDEDLNQPSKDAQVLASPKDLDAVTPKAKSLQSSPPPNIIWSSEKGEDGKSKHGEPPLFVRVGMLMIELPDGETQRKGFYSPHANLLTQIKGGYKTLKPKG